MHVVSDIATDPSAWQTAISEGNRTFLTGDVNGVEVRVVVNSKTGVIVTGYPVNLPRNP